MEDFSFKIIASQSSHNAAVYGLSKSNGNHSFFSASGDRFIAEWNGKTLAQETFAIKLEEAAYVVFAIPNSGKIAIGTASGAIHIVDRVSKQEIKNLAVHRNGVYAFAFLQEQEMLISCGGDGSLALWSTANWNLIRQLPIGDFKIRSIANTSDEKHIAIGCGEGTIRILETNFFNEIHTIKAHQDGVGALQFMATKPVLLSGGKDGFLRVWNLKDNYTQLLELPAHYSAIYSIALSQDEKHLVTTSRDKSFKLWKLPEFEVFQRVEARDGGHSHSVNGALWLSNSEFVTCGDDRKIILSSIS
jgi:WD40 repeat protein